MKLLADTGALLALFNPRDALHQRARKFARDAAGTRFVVTELILSETVTRLRARTAPQQSDPIYFQSPDATKPAQ